MQGLEQLSIARLASAVKMSKSGLFAHFGSKEELQLATIQAAWDIFEAQVLRDHEEEEEEEEEERSDELAALLERWLSFSERKVFPGGCLFVHQAVEFAARPGQVRDALQLAVARQIQAIEERLSGAWKPRGRPKKDASQVAFELHSIVINADALSRVEEDPAVFSQARAAIQAVRRTPSKMAGRRPAHSLR